jgi:hypothetical protein
MRRRAIERRLQSNPTSRRFCTPLRHTCHSSKPSEVIAAVRPRLRQCHKSFIFATKSVFHYRQSTNSLSLHSDLIHLFIRGGASDDRPRFDDIKPHQLLIAQISSAVKLTLILTLTVFHIYSAAIQSHQLRCRLHLKGSPTNFRFPHTNGFRSLRERE